MPDNNRAFDWDSEVEYQESSYEPLPEGDYMFTVVDMERGNYNGSDRIPPCPVAKITMDVKDAAGHTGQVQDRLYLCESSRWKLCQFFVGIGQIRKDQVQNGQKLRFDWTKVKGARGTLKLTVSTREYQGKKYTNNNVQTYYEPAAKPAGRSWQVGVL